MSLIQGINKTTNKQTILNIDDDGNLKIDESGKLTDINTNINTLYNYTINNDLRYLRSQGKCFSITYNYVSTATSLNMLSLWNPVGSGKKLYVYRIAAQFDNDGTADFATRVILYGTSSQPTSGNLSTPRNLSLGNNTTSTAEARNGYTNGSNYVISNLMTADEPGLNLYNTFEYPEYIEIAEGNGIFTKLFANTSTNKLRAMNTFYYIESDSTIPQ